MSIILTVADAAQYSSIQLQSATFRTLTLRLEQGIRKKLSQNKQKYYF